MEEGYLRPRDFYEMFHFHQKCSNLVLTKNMGSKSVDGENFLTAFFLGIWFPFTKIQSIYKRLSVQKETQRRVLFSEILSLMQSKTWQLMHPMQNWWLFKRLGINWNPSSTLSFPKTKTTWAAISQSVLAWV